MPEPLSTLSERSKWLLMAAIALGAVVLLLLAAEGAVRVRHALKYGSTQTVEDLYAVDPRTKLRVPIAGKSAGPIAINTLGFRGPEIVALKAAGTIRLAFLGASTTFCAEVSSNEAAWPHRVTSALAERFPQRRFDYVNGAVPGYILENIQRNLAIRVAPLDPDVIVIYEAANDLSRELRERAVAAGVLREVKLTERSWLARHSLLWELVEKNLRIRDAQTAAEQGASRLDVDAAKLGEGYRRDLRALVAEAKRHAKVVAIATFSIQPRAGQSEDEQRKASASAFFYMPFATAPLLIRAYSRYNEIAREVARETGVLLIEDETFIPGDATHFADTVHFTDAGSDRMAQRVTRALAEAPAFRGVISARAGPAQHGPASRRDPRTR